MITNIPITRQRVFIEGYGYNVDLNIELVYNYLESLSERLRMTILIPPQIVRVPLKTVEYSYNDEGISAQMIWMESGVSIHSWSKFSFISCDIFSCREFVPLDAILLFKEYFKCDRIMMSEPKEFVEIGEGVIGRYLDDKF